MNTLQDFNLNRWLRSTPGQIFLIFLVIAAFYLLTEHTAHVLGALPYALLFLCPLLHLFMHGGHGDHAGHSSPPVQQKSQADRQNNQDDNGFDNSQGHIH